VQVRAPSLSFSLRSWRLGGSSVNIMSPDVSILTDAITEKQRGIFAETRDLTDNS
jgi:hypothetical protein